MLTPRVGAKEVVPAFQLWIASTGLEPASLDSIDGRTPQAKTNMPPLAKSLEGKGAGWFARRMETAAVIERKQMQVLAFGAAQ